VRPCPVLLESERPFFFFAALMIRACSLPIPMMAWWVWEFVSSIPSFDSCTLVEEKPNPGLDLNDGGPVLPIRIYSIAMAECF